MTENIVHVVLAKVPDTDGRVVDDLSAVHVFLVSKRELDVSTGQLGEMNRVSVSSIEHKMGIEASATCVLDFDQVRAWRIAGQGEGSSGNMAAMFLLMNYARMGTAISGIAYADMAYQNAAAYARERISGRSAGGVQAPGQVADPIIVHADVRRMLLESRAFAEGARALALRVALFQSEATDAADNEQRRKASDMVELMTPVMKAYFTDCGYTAANACQQVLGGHGYVRDWGLEQMVRNARIGQIYEGANGVQAIDLVTRKLRAHGGRRVQVFRDALLATIKRCSMQPALVDLAERLQAGLARLAQAHEAVGLQVAKDPHAPTAAAYDLMTMYGILALGWVWLELAEVVQQLVDDTTGTVGHPKMYLAHVWFDRQIPCLGGLAERVQHGSQALMALEDAQV